MFFIDLLGVLDRIFLRIDWNDHHLSRFKIHHFHLLQAGLPIMEMGHQQISLNAVLIGFGRLV